MIESKKRKLNDISNELDSNDGSDEISSNENTQEPPELDTNDSVSHIEITTNNSAVIEKNLSNELDINKDSETFTKNKITKDSSDSDSDDSASSIETKVTINGTNKQTPFDTSDNSSDSESEELIDSSRKPAWVDDGDSYTVQEVIDIQGRKCNVGSNAGEDYKKTIEGNFQSVMGAPKWSKRKLKSNKDEFLTQGGRLTKKSAALEKGTIELQKLKNLNDETYCEGPIIKSILFHPTSTVALVAGLSGNASLYQVDGKTNTKLQTIQFKRFPINCAQFSNNGNEFIVGSSQFSYFYSYDMMTGRSDRIINSKVNAITNMKNFKVTPDGKYIVVVGHSGNIHMLSALTKEYITTMRMNGDVTAIEFNGSLMYSHGSEGEVYVWDMNTRLCIHKFTDDGCITGLSLSVSPNGKLIACGSSTGVVNIYNLDLAKAEKYPKPLKTVLNLVTPVNCVKFNPTSELLCMSSDYKGNAIKLLHCSSMTVFSNFPNFQAKFNRPQCIDFSPNSGYMAFGDNRKTAHLFRLKYYGNY